MADINRMMEIARFAMIGEGFETVTISWKERLNAKSGVMTVSGEMQGQRKRVELYLDTAVPDERVFTNIEESVVGFANATKELVVI